MEKPTPPQPTGNTSRPSVAIFLWRYFSGNHLDGQARTNAGWFSSGNSPTHHANWWTSKPRIQRAMWRWAIIGIPAGLIAAYAYAPTIHVNLTVFIALAVFPYLFHHGTMKALRLVPRTRVVYAEDRISANDIHPSLDDVYSPREVIPDLSESDITQEMDTAVFNATHVDDDDEKSVRPIRRTRRGA
jgi:hypothetical protein